MEVKQKERLDTPGKEHVKPVSDYDQERRTALPSVSVSKPNVFQHV